MTDRISLSSFLKMQMYDLRYPNKRGLLSNPCLVFDGYDSGFWHHIDLSCELGLVASGKHLSVPSHRVYVCCANA